MYFNTETVPLRVGVTSREATPTFLRDQGGKNGFGIGQSVHSEGELILSSACDQYSQIPLSEYHLAEWNAYVNKFPSTVLESAFEAQFRRLFIAHN